MAFIQHEGLGGAPVRRPGVHAVVGRAFGACRRSRTRSVFPFAPPADHRARQRRRLRLLPARRQRPGPCGTARGAQPAAAARRRRASCWPACGRTARRTHRCSGGHRQREVRRARRLGRRPQHTLEHRLGRRATSTTSWTADGSSASSCRRDAPFRMQPEDFARWYVRNGAGAMVPVSALATSRWTRSAAARALQRRLGDGDQRRRGARRQLRRRDGGDRTARRHAASRLQRRVGGTILRGAGRGHADAGALCALARGRVPLPRSALRELARAERDPACRAARHRRCGARRRAPRPRERHLLQGRHADHRGTRRARTRS